MNKKVFIAAVVIFVLLVPAVLILFNITKVTGNEVLDNIVSIMNRLSNGIWSSLILFGLTLLFSMPIGLLVTFARRSRFKVVEMITKFYISVMRGTPLMLQLIVVYFAPYYLFKIPLSSDYRFYAAVIGFSLNYAAYFAEILPQRYRGGTQRTL